MYDGDVGLYCGDGGPYCGDGGLYSEDAGLYCGVAGPYCGDINLGFLALEQLGDPGGDFLLDVEAIGL